MSVIDERRSHLLEKEAAERSAKIDGHGNESKRVAGEQPVARRAGTYPVTIGNHTLYFPEVVPETPGAVYQYAKRAADVTISAVLLLFLLLPFAIIAAIIFLEDGGSVFYYQTRVGRDGKHFRFYKFRSMVRNADAIKAQLAAQNEATGPIFKMRNDPRITRVGRVLRRYSIDELPQLVNVLAGQMSLIGPRPHLPSEVARYTEAQSARLKAQPGLLCFREVFGRSDVSFDQWIELDILYIRYRSFQTDMRILARLVPAILSAEGAY
jgi:lipopolysaccharide/colanic/teichoic acid biosynthesis glycosyltransferase